MDRRKLVVLIGAWVIILIFQAYWFLEPGRMSAAEDRFRAEAVARGADLYAANCVVCHGPDGEGVIGPTVDRPEWREGSEAELDAAADVIRQVLVRGRQGQAETTWIVHEDGTIESETTMPAWHREEGGTLNDQGISDLVTFLQHGEWDMVSVENIPEPINLEAGEPSQPLPKPANLSQAEYQQGVDALVAKGCLQCHQVGAVGGNQGPNLTFTGEWIPSEEFLRQWILDPASIPNEDRGPTVWLRNNFDSPQPITKDPVMPAFEGSITDEELDAIVNYLMHLTRDEME